MATRIRTTGVAAIGLGILTLCLTSAAAQAKPPAKTLSLSAFAVDLAGARTSAEQLDIVIEHWSPNADRDRLVETLEGKGSGELMSALRSLKPRAGYIRTTSSLGWDIQYAQEFPLPDGGRKIVFATDRPMSIIERQSGNRSRDYDFILGEIHLDAQGQGQGKLATMAKVSYDKPSNTIEIEDYNAEPTRLTDVHSVS